MSDVKHSTNTLETPSKTRPRMYINIFYTEDTYKILEIEVMPNQTLKSLRDKALKLHPNKGIVRVGYWDTALNPIKPN